MLSVGGLTKRFGGVVAVRDVSFAVASGEMVALIGPNGAGKTTCFNMVGGQLRPDAGRVLLDGADITGLRARDIWRRGVGRTFQITATFASMTVRENVQMALLSRAGEASRVVGAAHAAHVAAADTLLDRVGLAALAERAAGLLAYGDLKRLDLAVALVGAPGIDVPRLLLMDEPTAGMALGERAALMRLVRALATERGVAVLFTEHDMDVVFGVADRIVVLARGEIVASGKPAAIRADPRVRAVYLGADG